MLMYYNKIGATALIINLSVGWNPLISCSSPSYCSANIKFNVNDTRQKSEELFVKIYWGDLNDIDTYILNGNDNNDYQYSFDKTHTYDCKQLSDINVINPQIRVQVMNEAGLSTYLIQTVDGLCEEYNTNNNVNDEDWILSSEYINIDTVEFTLELTRGGNIYGGPGSQVFYFEAASNDMFINETNLQDPDNDFSTLGLWKFSNGDNNQTVPVNVTLNEFEWKLKSNILYIRFTCRTYNMYIYSYLKARIIKIRLKLLSGNYIDLYGNIDYIDSNDYDPIICSRRGNLYSDNQQLSVIKLNVLNMTRLNEKDESYNEYINDGIYYEILPGQFEYINASSIEFPSDPPTTTSDTEISTTFDAEISTTNDLEITTSDTEISTTFDADISSTFDAEISTTNDLESTTSDTKITRIYETETPNVSDADELRCIFVLWFSMVVVFR